MNVEHVTVLANPTARHGAGRSVADAAASALRARGVTVDVHVGRDDTHARTQVEDAVRGGTDALVVVGGDGSVRLTVEASWRSGTPIAVIPAGSGNDVARNLGIPLGDPAAAAALVLDGQITPVDVGLVTFPEGHSALFMTVAATGFDAAVTRRANAMRWPRGQARYTLAAMRELVGLRSLHYNVRIDDDSFDSDLVFAAIGNASSYGGGMQITPDASMQDGLLHVTMARHPKRRARLTIAKVFPKVFSGKHVHHRLVYTRRGTQVELYSDPLGLVSIDGDLVGTLPAVFDIEPGGMAIFVPS